MKDYEIQKEKSDFGEDILVYVQEGTSKRVPLNSTYSSKREAEKFVGKHIDKNFFVLIGIGNGDIIRNWIESSGEYFHLLIIEPFDKVSLKSDLIELIQENENISFFYYSELTTLSIVDFFQITIGIETKILVHPHYDKTDLNYLSELIDHLSQAQKLVKMNRNTEFVFRKEWVIQPLLNLQYTKEMTPVDVLKNKFKGQKAILCSSGPSLRENIEFVQRMKDYAYVFASGSAVNGLINNGVEPDFSVVFDASKINYEAHFKDSNYQGILIAGATVTTEILEEHKGEALFCNINSDYITQYIHDKLDVFGASSSVSILAMQLIYYMGFSEVYLVGQDLALLNGHYYAEGVHKHENLKFVKNELLVENNEGKKVPTTLSLFSNLESFNDLLKSLDNTKMKIYNLSKQGAKIEGVPYCNPNDITQPAELRKEILFEVNKTIVTNDGISTCSYIINELKKLLSQVEKMKTNLNRLNNEIINDSEMKKVLKWFKRLREHNILEKVVIKQLFFYVQKLSNDFYFNMHKEYYSNKDRVEMVGKIKSFVVALEQYLKILLNDERIKKFESRNIDKG